MDFTNELINVARSVWHNVEGDTKTAASRKPVLIHSAVVKETKRWKKVSSYNSEHDYMFPSVLANGKHPIDPAIVLQKYIRTALERLNINKTITWHSFRHGFSNLLRQSGVDVKTAQELLRHSSSRITLDIYQQTVTKERRAAQVVLYRALMGK